MSTEMKAWIYVILYFALAICAVLTFGCKPYLPPAQAYTIKTAEGVTLPDSANGWQILRTGINEYTFVPPKPAPYRAKYKNVGNDYSKEKSKVKDTNNTTTKAKGDGIIGNDNAPVEARKQAVVGDGNTVEMKQGKSLWWLWLLLGMGVVLGIRLVLRRSPF